MVYFNKLKRNTKFINNLMSFIWPEFIKIKNGLIFFGNENIKDVSVGDKAPLNMDSTSIEVLENHFHLEEIFKIKSSPEIANIAKTIGEIWSLKLKKDFPNHHFRIYLTWEDELILRFHQVHEGEPFWLNEEDWSEQIEKGKIIIWDVK